MHKSLRWGIALSLAFAGALLLSSKAAAPTPITFWHYVSAKPGADVIQSFANEFNASQSQYAVKVVEISDYRTLQIKLQAALSAKGDLPTLVQVDNGFFTRLALGGLLTDATVNLNAVPKATLEDFDGTLLAYGSVAGKRFGLPWASSTLIQLYNADAFKQKGLSAPRTWDDFVKAAKALTTRNSRGAIFFIDAWIYASMVSSRGGDILDGGTRPALDSAGSLQTLQMMVDLTKNNQAIVRNFSEANLAVIDWVRTKAFIVTLPTSAFPIIKDTLPFKVGAVPMPGRTLAGESQIVMPKGKSAVETQGAFAFWSYLTRPENAARFSKATYYLPLRKSAVKQLGDFVNDPIMKAGLEALQKAYNPPQLNAYNDWRLILEAQLERSLKGGVDPKVSLTEAQRQALLVR